MSSRSMRTAGLSSYNEDLLEDALMMGRPTGSTGPALVKKQRMGPKGKPNAPPAPRKVKQNIARPGDLVSLPMGRAVATKPKSCEHLETEKFYGIGAHGRRESGDDDRSKPNAFNAQGWHAYMRAKQVHQTAGAVSGSPHDARVDQ
jgi:hypothetical protein